MGMFDYVLSEKPLPDGFSGELQTKDFDCDMTTITITTDGRLLIDRIIERVKVPRAERRYPDAPNGSIDSFIGSVRSIKKRVDLEHHGMFNFYGNDSDGVWHEYNAKFTDGALVDIKQVPST